MAIINIQPVTDENYDMVKNHDLYGKQLTKTETAVLLLITKGLSNQEIANELGSAHQTIKNHVSAIYAKFNIVSDRQLIAAYYREEIPAELILQFYRLAINH